MPTSYKVVWDGSHQALEQAQTVLTEIFWPPAEAVSLTKDDLTKTDHDTSWKLEAYFTNPPDLSTLNTFLSDEAGLSSGKLEQLPDIDWVAHSLDGLGVVRCGRFVLYGVHDTDKLPDEEGDINIRIDANQAFGTGHHPTTAGCLSLLDRLGGWAPKTILDLGCGSAVLAIAAAKLWERSILASDIDAPSIDFAKENARLNHVDQHLTFLTAAGFDHPKISSAAPFEFIFANILAGPLVELAPHMATYTLKSGRIMLAGFMREQEETVRQAYESLGFRLLNRLDHETWPVFLFAKT